MKPMLTTFALLFACLHSLANQLFAAQRPNILLILPDQMRASAMGYDGNAEVKTPNIDRLAAEGIRFHWTYANVPVCCPARAILMTGTYPHVNGMVASDLRLREEQVTIAEILAAAGYRMGFIGKWHLDGICAIRRMMQVVLHLKFPLFCGFRVMHGMLEVIGSNP